jgi:hypothetical protein
MNHLSRKTKQKQTIMLDSGKLHQTLQLIRDMMMAVFWVVALCSLVEIYQRFRGPCFLHHQDDEYTALQPRRQPSSYSPPSEPKILQMLLPSQCHQQKLHISERVRSVWAQSINLQNTKCFLPCYWTISQIYNCINF